MFESSEPVQSKTRLITRRMFLLTGVKLAVFIGIISRLFYLQISENIKYRSLSDKNRLREWKVPPQRGIIEDFFGEKTSLTVSGQLEGEIYALALSDIYTFGPTFRAENSNTSRHLSEFWMVEPEMAFYDLDDDMDLAEEFIKYLFVDALENCSEDMEFFNQRIDKTILECPNKPSHFYSHKMHLLKQRSGFYLSGRCAFPFFNS